MLTSCVTRFDTKCLMIASLIKFVMFVEDLYLRPVSGSNLVATNKKLVLKTRCDEDLKNSKWLEAIKMNDHDKNDITASTPRECLDTVVLS